MRSIAADVTPNGRGRVTLGGEPLVFHCNHYNYFLQSTLLLDPSLGMAAVIRDAAEAVVFSCLSNLPRQASRREEAEALFSELGFGTISLGSLSEDGGLAPTPTSHYGQALVMANEGRHFSEPQNLFDQGFAAAAASWIHHLPPGSFVATSEGCFSQGAAAAGVRLRRADAPRHLEPTCGLGRLDTNPIPGITSPSNINESAIHAALATLDFSGNEEGLIPRFGVMLTRHFANFYNRISFEFVRRMAGSRLEREARELLVEAGHRCAFNTFGGIMTSAEWDAVIRPQCRTTEDWVHGMVAVVNALGWGTWRVLRADSSELQLQAWDDYESFGYLGQFGRAQASTCYLLEGGVAGLMNLVYPGHIQSAPRLDPSFYAKVFESPERFTASVSACAASGDVATIVQARR